MTSKELYESIRQDIDSKQNLPLLLDEVLMECCENVVESNPLVDKNTLKVCCMASFPIVLELLKSTIKMQAKHADTITLNYRGKVFIFNPQKVELW